MDEIKQHGTIDEYRVYTFNNLDNIYVAVLMPEKWNFEWMETPFGRSLSYWSVKGIGWRWR
jgi:hypothetical protein